MRVPVRLDSMLSTNRLPGCLAAALLCLAPGLSAQKADGSSRPTRDSIPIALFEVHPPEGDAPLSVRFKDRSFGGATSWAWNFGDGTTSSQQNPTHVYTEGGVYAVRLTVSGPNGTDTLEKPRGVIARRCIPGNARVNQSAPLERGEEFIPVVGDDSLGFYCVYSGKATSQTNPSLSNNVGMFLFPLSDGGVLLFGSGYGDSNWLVTATASAEHDVRRVDSIIRFCLGRDPRTTPIHFVAPHGHIDHINADCIRELRRRGYPIAEIVFHTLDAASSKGLPGWSGQDKSVFRTLQNNTADCQEELDSFASPLGKLWFYRREGHTPGALDLVIDVLDDPKNRFVVRGSGGTFGSCPIPNMREAIDPHGNVQLKAPPPQLLDVTPKQGSSFGGTSLTLSGGDFRANLAGVPTVLIDGSPAGDVTILDDETIQCTAPPGSPGRVVDIALLNMNGLASLENGFSYRPFPTLTGLSPSRGLLTGGTRVTLSGSGFQDGSPGSTSVTFDGLAAAAVQVLDDRTLLCTTPPGDSGLASVRVSNQNGSAELAGAFLFDPAIDVIDVSPGAGPSRGRTRVTITGSAFAVGTRVPDIFFGDVPGTDVVRLSDSRIQATTPSGPGGVPVDVRVSGENGSDVLFGGFRYFSEPSVSGLNPGSGPRQGGTPVLVSGSQFVLNSAGVNTVTFGGVGATGVQTLSDTQIQCLVPTGVAGTQVEVAVSNMNGKGTLADAYRYHRLPLPLSATPDGGPRAGGTLVTITGNGFLETGAGQTIVRFGGSRALDVTVVDDVTLTCITPSRASEVTVDIEVINGNGRGVLAQSFRYLTRPFLTSIQPDRGPARSGTLVTLTGTGFQASDAGTTLVTFHGRPATHVVVQSNTSLTCRAPLGQPGTLADVRVSNQNGGARMAAAFRYLDLPRISSLRPDEGPLEGGTPVTLRGSGFQPGDPASVTFGGLPAFDLLVVAEGVLTCTTPPGAAGATDVSLKTAGGRVVAHDVFVYGSTATRLDGISPQHGPGSGGTPVLLDGAHFTANGAGTNRVSFGGVEATKVLASNDGRISCVAPAGTPGSRVDVSVTNSNGAATLHEAYRYNQPPALLSATPPDGSPDGGEVVTLLGSGFLVDEATGHGVLFGLAPATDIVVIDDATLTCRSPASPHGTTVDIALALSNGEARLVAAFTYRGAPVLEAIAPTSGPPQGGTLVTLTGNGFTASGAGPMAVRFGTDPATQITVLDDRTLTCLAPAGAQGSRVDVRVNNANGTDTLTGAYRFHVAPAIASIFPPNGPASGGTSVLIRGVGFQTDVTGANTVLFDDTPALSVTTIDDTRVRAIAPPGTPGETRTIELFNNNGNDRSPQGFRTNAVPTISAFSPEGSNDSGALTVTILGSGFLVDGAGTNLVAFGPNQATAVSVVDDAKLTCLVPPGIGGTQVSLGLTNDNGEALAPTTYHYYPPPRVDDISPAHGFSGGNTLVEIRGSGLMTPGAGANTVTFGGIPGTEVTTVDDGTVRCRTPAGQAGPVTVGIENANGSASRLDGFYYDFVPTLIDLAPNQGTSLGGTEVRLTGGGFDTPGAGPLSVRFGANLATNVRILDGKTLLCNTPVGPAATTASVSVSNSRGTSSVTGFQYRARPTIVSVEPPSGPPEGGTRVTVRGTGFLSNEAGPPLIRFAGLQATQVTVLDDTALLCTAPAGSDRSTATLTLANQNGLASFFDGFRWLAPDPGDVNDDGFGDALLSAGDGVYLFFGSAFGLGDESTTSADLVFRAVTSGTGFGTQVTSGDLNADKVADLAISAPLDDIGGADIGAVYVFFGPFAASPTPRFSSSADAIFRGAAQGDRFGTSLSVREVSGDATRDLIVGAPFNDVAGDDGGAVYVYPGGPSFSGQAPGQAAVRLTASDKKHNFGAAVAAGDMTGDGRADLLVGAPRDSAAGGDSGAAYVFRGGASLTSTTASSALARIDGASSGDLFGSSVAVGDFDGDGIADLFLSAPEAGPTLGGILYGIRGGGTLASGSASTAPVQLEPEGLGDGIGATMAIGDANGDGKADLLVGAPLHDVPTTNSGRAYLLLGGAPPSGPIALRAHMILVSENSAGDQFGTGLAFGDLDDDGLDDILVGAPFSNGGGTDSGRVHVFLGSGLQATRSAVADDATFTGANVLQQLGRSLGSER